MNSIRFTPKIILVACLVVVLLAGTAMASFDRAFPESEKIVALGIALIGLSFVTKRFLKQ